MQESLTQDAGAARDTRRAGWRRWEWPALGMIVLVAFAVRAWTVRGGLPFVDHPDEPNPINYVVAMLQTGDPNPHFFQKPSLYVYLLLAVLTLHYRLGHATGLYGDLSQMLITTHRYTTIPGFFLWGRMLTVVIGSLMVLTAFGLGKRVWGRAAGLLAALFVALSPFLMRHSQYVTTDVPSAWLVLLAFAAAIAVARAGRWRDYLAAGAFVGLAASTKYNAGVVALTVIAAHGLYWKRRSLVRLPLLISAGLAALIGFLVGTPYALLSWPEFLQGLLGQVGDYGAGIHGDFVGAWNLGGYLEFFWGEGLGAIACVALVAGIVLLLRHRRDVGLIWLSFAVPYLLLHLAQSSHFVRNLVPMVGMSALPIGVAGAALIAWVSERAPRYRVVLGAAVLLALLLPSAAETLGYSARLARGDTRVQALSWIDANVPPGARIAAELPPLPGESRWAQAAALPQHDLSWYRQQGYGYLLASSDVWKQWPIPASYSQMAGAPLAEFGGADARAMLGPHLALYATGLTAADVPQPLAQIVQLGGAQLLGAVLGQPDESALGVQPARVFKAGEVLGLRSFWQVEQPFQGDFFIFIHLLDAAGKTVAQRDAPPWQGHFPTSSWHPGSIVVDVNDLPLPAGLPPGDYTIVIGMFDPASGAHPTTRVNGQTQTTDAVRLTTISIKR
jgi:4-amino-4-deoxy-L-arabinose transferase-like glycosyltransferase